MNDNRRVDELEKRVAALEVQAQEQPSVEEIVKSISEKLRLQMSKSHNPINPYRR